MQPFDDGQIRAWVEVNPQEPLGKGPLDGVTFGAKDIFETTGMATEYGSPVFEGRKGSCDAVVITELRKQGAVLLGKTQTAALAYFDPAPTRNPRDLNHTPGGSSSGSAAAVAAGMCVFALGTQTAGSIIRPASYCGVAGFKPTFGTLSREGVLPFAKSLDTVGLFARDMQWMAKVWSALGQAVTNPAYRTLNVPSNIPVTEPEMENAFRHTLERLYWAGFHLDMIELPFHWTEIVAAVRAVQDYEGARTHRELLERHGDRIGAKMAELIRRGLAMDESEYSDALGKLRDASGKMDGLGFVVTPAAMGTAPEGLSSTGAPTMNSPWTGLGLPAISTPMKVEGLPMGLQIAGERGGDGRLLALGIAVERELR
jgi:Asp-tRNA(Asn)/Glu-tRNA(Gln) amidotransferase A subunit family amidase